MQRGAAGRFVQFAQGLFRVGHQPGAAEDELPAAAAGLVPEEGRADAAEQRRAHLIDDPRVGQVAVFAVDDDARGERA